jgi:hypothetical protein
MRVKSAYAWSLPTTLTDRQTNGACIAVRIAARVHKYPAQPPHRNLLNCRKLVVLRPVGKCRPLLRCCFQFRPCVLVQRDAGGRHVLLQVGHG